MSGVADPICCRPQTIACAACVNRIPPDTGYRMAGMSDARAQSWGSVLPDIRNHMAEVVDTRACAELSYMFCQDAGHGCGASE